MPIGLEGASYLLFAVYYWVKEENKVKIGVILEKVWAVNANDNYICSFFKDSNSNKYGFFGKDKKNNYLKNIADSS